MVVVVVEIGFVGVEFMVRFKGYVLFENVISDFFKVVVVIKGEGLLVIYMVSNLLNVEEKVS